MHTTDSRLVDFVTNLPAPDNTPFARLAHTLDCYAQASNIHLVGDTTITWGDLRQLHAGRRTPTLVAATARCEEPDDRFLVTTTVDVYGAGVRTGLRWGDLRSLLA